MSAYCHTLLSSTNSLRLLRILEKIINSIMVGPTVEANLETLFQQSHLRKKLERSISIILHKNTDSKTY